MVGDFTSLLAPFDLGELEVDASPICGLRADLRVAYVNPAWVAFGVANGSPSMEASAALGTRITDTVPEDPRPRFERLLERVRVTRQPAEHDYDCSTRTLRRTFRMRVHPCTAGGIVVVHSLYREAPHTSVVEEALDADYRNARGMIVLCSNCRRSRRVATGEAQEELWDWVPRYALTPPEATSHGVCGPCAADHYV